MDPDSYRQFLILNAKAANQLLPQAELSMAPVAVALLVTVVFLAISAVMSASEVAYFSLSQPELEELEADENEAGERVARLMQKPKYLLSTILIFNNLINIGIVVISYFITERILHFSDLQIGPFLLKGSSSEFIVNVVVVTFFLVLFGEATPKVYATHHKKNIAIRLSGFFTGLVRLFAPINYVIVNATGIVEKRLRKRSAEIDLEEINKAIEITSGTKEEKQDASILKGIVQFGNLTVKQVMRPRMEMAFVDQDASFSELKNKIRDFGYSRLPVCHENPDNVTGVLYVKDLLEHLDKGDLFRWQNLVREPFFVPENKKIDDLMREIQKNRKHMAVVVDEYGGTSGIITLEDIIEEVLGDISDEFDDQAELAYRQLDANNFLFDGKTNISDFCRLMKLNADHFDAWREDAETLAGLYLQQSGRMPVPNDSIELGGFLFTVVTLQKNRIDRLRISRRDSL